MAAMKSATSFPRAFRPQLLAAVALVSMIFSTNAFAAERWATLEAIHWIENPHDSPKPGRFGELGAYQFREMTWRMHSSVAFSHAIERGVSDEVAVKHYEWLKRGLERNGLAATTYNIALAWNAGLGSVVRGRVPASTRNYAERANNIAESLSQGRVAMGR